jgi:hypothetical protein
MPVEVQTQKDARGIEVPRRIETASGHIEVAELLDQWDGADYRYFKFRDVVGDLYILRFDEPRCVWELTLYESARARAE